MAPLRVIINIDGRELPMEIDTGATRSVISGKTFDQLGITACASTLQPTTTRLRTYTGETLKVMEFEVVVKLGTQQDRLPLLVIDGDVPSLIGRDWLARLNVDMCQLNHVSSSNELQKILNKHAKVFNEELGLIEGVRARVFIDSKASLKYCRARTVPYALRDKVEQELARLQKQGVIEPVRFADWAAPVVPMVKSDGKIRLCRDYKVTINQASEDKYPLPRINDLLASLTGGKYFSKLDKHICRFHLKKILRITRLPIHTWDSINITGYRSVFHRHQRYFNKR